MAPISGHVYIFLNCRLAGFFCTVERRNIFDLIAQDNHPTNFSCINVSRTNIASVGSVFNYTRKVKVLSLPETIKEKSTFRELVVGGRGKPRVFLYELIQKHHVTK